MGSIKQGRQRNPPGGASWTWLFVQMPAHKDGVTIAALWTLTVMCRAGLAIRIPGDFVELARFPYTPNSPAGRLRRPTNGVHDLAAHAGTDGQLQNAEGARAGFRCSQMPGAPPPPIGARAAESIEGLPIATRSHVGRADHRPPFHSTSVGGLCVIRQQWARKRSALWRGGIAHVSVQTGRPLASLQSRGRTSETFGQGYFDPRPAEPIKCERRIVEGLLNSHDRRQAGERPAFPSRS